MPSDQFSNVVDLTRRKDLANCPLFPKGFLLIRGRQFVMLNSYGFHIALF